MNFESGYLNFTKFQEKKTKQGPDLSRSKGLRLLQRSDTDRKEVYFVHGSEIKYTQTHIPHIFDHN